MSEKNYTPVDIRRWRTGESLAPEKLNEISDWMWYFFRGNHTITRYTPVSNLTVPLNLADLQIEDLRTSLTTYGGGVQVTIILPACYRSGGNSLMGCKILIDDSIYMSSGTDTPISSYGVSQWRHRSADVGVFNIDADYFGLEPGPHTFVPIVVQNSATYTVTLQAGFELVMCVKEIPLRRSGAFNDVI